MNYCEAKFHHLWRLRDCDAALAMSVIQNTIRLQCERQKGKDQLVRDEYWVKCPMKRLQGLLGISKFKVQRAVAKLVEAGMIELTHWKGNETWVRVDARVLGRIQLEFREWEASSRM